MPRLVSRVIAPLLATVALTTVSVACSKSPSSDQTTTTTTSSSVDSLTTTPSASAAPGAGGAGGPGAPGGRRQAMFDACSGKNANDACTVTFGTRTMNGNCAAMTQGPNAGQLGCRPAPGAMHGGMHGMGAPGAPGAPPSPPAPAPAPH